MKPLAHSLSRVEINALCAELGAPRYRSDQLWQWLYTKRAESWDEVRTLPRALREKLAERIELAPLALVELQGPPEGTRKILAELPDGERVEAVLLPATNAVSRDGTASKRRTVCVSSQVGCRYKCAFCASGQAGFGRNLETGEIIGQVMLAAREFGEAPTHVVFMGMGEPFDNYDAVLKAVRILNDPNGLTIGARRMTLSTSGVIPGIERLAEEGIQVELSVSLHAPDNALRSRLMPVNQRYPLPDLLAACRAYGERTRRLITFEYTLIRGMNDRPEHARALIQALRGIRARVNLIPLSPVAEFEGQTATPEATEGFMLTLTDAGLNVTVRRSEGRGLQAACGQLRYRRSEPNDA